MSKATDAAVAVVDFALGCAVRHVENMMAPIEVATEMAAYGKVSEATTDRMFNSLVSSGQSDLAHRILK